MIDLIIGTAILSVLLIETEAKLTAKALKDQALYNQIEDLFNRIRKYNQEFLVLTVIAVIAIILESLFLEA
jgi:hypothetical protein